MASATMLMAGLTSCLFLAARAFDGNAQTATRARDADIQAEMLDDLGEATSFTTRTAQSVTFTVPDRTGDELEESITYSWTGLPAAELTYSMNGSPSVTLLKDVRDFNLSYLNRFMAGGTPPLPPLEPNRWGTRWITGQNFGYETTFATTAKDRRTQIATRVTLASSGTLQSITAYFSVVAGQNSEIGFAIYNVDSNLNPKNLLANTGQIRVYTTGWVTLATSAINLSPGQYYLALCHDSLDVSYHQSSTGGETHTKSSDALKVGWTNPFGSSSESSRQISIYGTIQTN